MAQVILARGGRRHKGLGQKSPINFEKELQDKANITTPVIATPSSADELKTYCFGPVKYQAA